MQVGGSTSSFSMQWQVKALQMQKEAIEMQGQAAIKLIQGAIAPQPATSGQPHLGQNIDIRV